MDSKQKLYYYYFLFETFNHSEAFASSLREQLRMSVYDVHKFIKWEIQRIFTMMWI